MPINFINYYFSKLLEHFNFTEEGEKRLEEQHMAPPLAKIGDEPSQSRTRLSFKGLELDLLSNTFGDLSNG